MLKHSHYRTPRTLAECQWVQGYASARPERPSWRETLAGAALSAAIFAALAAVRFFWWSA